LTLPLVDLGRTMVVPEAVRLLPRAVAERSGVLVLERNGNKITVATADPTNVVALDDVKLYTGAVELSVLVATDSQVRDHLARSWSLSEDSSDVHTLFEGMDDGPAEPEDAGTSATDAAPIVRLVDVVLADAVRARASDVHVEPQAGELRIRYRIDGLLRDVMTVPRNASAATVSRIKIVSGLDIAERRRPQDGRAKLTVDGLTVEARISTLPTLHGEKVVIRLLPRADNVPTLKGTGLTAPQLELLSTALVQAQGLVLITGPTGSGKTNTLYAGIQQVSTPTATSSRSRTRSRSRCRASRRCRCTSAPGSPSPAGCAASCARTPTSSWSARSATPRPPSWRSRPRSPATSCSRRCTPTTPSPRSPPGRHGVEPVPRGVVADARRRPAPGAAAVRAVRRAVHAVAAHAGPARAHRGRPGRLAPLEGKGCAECAGTGYLGRTGVFEVLPVTTALRKVLLTTPTEAAIGAAARANGC
jgi:type IV pilus assembly protein PilB